MPWGQVLEKVVPAKLLEDSEKLHIDVFVEENMSDDFLTFFLRRI